MEAPDKIYIHTRTEPYCSITWSEVKEKNCTNEEYIRKDALLEWAKEHYTGLDITKRDMWDGGYNCAIKELINILNEM